VRVELDDILYAESSGNYVQFITDKQRILSRLTMSEAEELLPAAFFIRIHRSYIIARKKISKIERRRVWIKQVELPVGAGYIGELEKLIK
jgi:DNA-binding LytR/AlgR family response regulator